MNEVKQNVQKVASEEKTWANILLLCITFIVLSLQNSISGKLWGILSTTNKSGSDLTTNQKNADKPNEIMQVIQLSYFQVKSPVAARCVPNPPRPS